MKVYSDTLTRDDLYAALPKGVGIAELRTMRNPRKRGNGWELSLEGYEGRHTHYRNSGGYGSDASMAATWDDHGVWMNNLYRLDPDALIAYYTSRYDFFVQTQHTAGWRQRSRFRYVRDTSRAPWLKQRMPA